MSKRPVLNLSDRIKELRQDRRWSQDELAEKAGVSRPAISQWESGVTKNIKNQTLVSLADAFGMSVDELLTGGYAKTRETSPPGYAGLSEQEKRLLEVFRQLSTDDRVRLKMIADVLREAPRHA